MNEIEFSEEITRVGICVDGNASRSTHDFEGFKFTDIIGNE